LYTFTGGADGGGPNGVVLDRKGNLYGTTQNGGNGSLTGVQEGVVFKLDPSGTETVLHSFTGFADGGGPTSGVILDSAGNVYGTTFSGGNGLGVVYELSPNGVETVLHTLTYPGDGGGPYAGVIRDSLGNLYGTAANFGPNGGGVVFRVDPAGNYTVLYGFSSSGIGGSAPVAGVIQDSDGNLYGTATASQNTGCFLGCGVIYMLSPTGQETVLYNFTSGSDGSYPNAGLTMDSSGNIYGTATFGGRAGSGVIYELSPPF
jgi:uncharacterized repeat protein (TIGR03803 family)